jgi:cation diffusion facilitator CzcD-associated flavoprotein CzcO
MPAADFDVAIAGTGFSGLGMAIALKREAKRSFVVFEKAASVGGTWRENDYPGCACDVPSHLYSFSFEQNPNWSRMFPTQPEIRAYLEATADKYRVRDNIRFNTAVTAARWDDAAQLWRVETSDGRVTTARVFVSGMGGLHVPQFPDLPGRESFAGASFHSAQWRHDVALEGKRVAIIGTGASAIQIAPAIAPKVAQLTLFQRTPPWVMPKMDPEIPEKRRAQFRRSPLRQRMFRRFIYAMMESRAPSFLSASKSGAQMTRMGKAHIASAIQDEALREKVTPSYRVGCKRILISNDYYPALARANVSVVTEPIAAIAPEGVVTADGATHGADVIVYATGFKPMDVITNVAITGPGERSLNEEWRDGPQAHWGIAVAGYPNFFLLMGPNTGLGHNSMVFMIESQIAYIMNALAELDARGAASLEPLADAQRAFNEDIEAKLAKSVWGSGCKSWYLSPDGKNRTLWPGYTFEYRWKTRRIRPEDYAFTPAKQPATRERELA